MQRSGLKGSILFLEKVYFYFWRINKNSEAAYGWRARSAPMGEFMSSKGRDQDLLVVNMQLRTRVMDTPQNASAGCDGI